MAKKSTPVTTDKLQDFERDTPYEKRVVAFYDILGWRSHIVAAASDPSKIGELRRIILLHSRIVRLPTEEPVQVSTFSDNIVLSIRPSKFVPYFLQALAMFQLMSANRGFLLRGGVSIGGLVHDSEVVFGPGLVKAYDLESQVAQFPRIVIDAELMTGYGELKGFNSFEDGIHFLDPFTVSTVRFFLQSGSGPRPPNRELGLPSHNQSLKQVRPDMFLSNILEQLKVHMRSPLLDRDWIKIAWLYDRIAKQLGVPPASSYPRVGA
jgi:hypothetical protein